MSMADDMIDDMLDRDMRVLDRLACFGATRDLHRGSAHTHSMDGIREAQRRVNKSDALKKRFAEMFRNDGGIPQWNFHTNYFYPITSVTTESLLLEISRIPRSDQLLGKIMSIPKEPPSTYLGGWYANINTWYEAVIALFEYEINRRASP